MNVNTAGLCLGLGMDVLELVSQASGIVHSPSDAIALNFLTNPRDFHFVPLLECAPSSKLNSPLDWRISRNKSAMTIHDWRKDDVAGKGDGPHCNARGSGDCAMAHQASEWKCFENQRNHEKK
jgi:hypothetical protein